MVKNLKSRIQRDMKTIQLVKKRWQLFLFLLVPVIYILVFNYYPMLGLQIAFKDFNAAKGIWGSPWVGFKHFSRFFNSFQFNRVVRNTIYISLYNLATSYPLAIIFSLLINSVTNIKFKKTIQTVTYIPHFVSTVVIVGMLMQVLNPINGLYGNIYSYFVGGGSPVDILGKSKAFIHLYNWSGIWQELGWSTIIYIAVLSSVNQEMHEAAQIDGANRLKRVIHVDFPAILPTASILLILRTGNIMSVGFEKVYLMQNNLNLIYSEVITTYVYKVGLSAGTGNYSFAAAIGLFNSIIGCSLLIIVNRIARKLESAGGSSLW